MIWTSHAVAGGVTAAVLSPWPPLAIAGALASHFVLDAIPHWDYKLKSLQVNQESEEVGLKFKFDKWFFYDCLKMAIDFSVGLILVWFFVASGHNSLWLIMIGAVLAVVPDWLFFIYSLWPNRFLKIFVRFHHFCHFLIKTENIFLAKPVFQTFLIFGLIWFF
ncbi:MAG: hypothetical protein ACOCU8_00600 [Patescibacteria group bacterium]